MLDMILHIISINTLLPTLVHCLFFQTAIAQPNIAQEKYNQQINLLLSQHNPHAEGLKKAIKSMNDREHKYALRPIETAGLAFIAITFPEFQLSDSWKNEDFNPLNNEIGIKSWEWPKQFIIEIK